MADVNDGWSMLNSSLQGLANTLGGIANSNKQFKNQKKAMAIANDYNLNSMKVANDYNVSMFDRQAQYNIDMWNRQNEYDSASAQVQRLRDAGLNPALAMGNAGMSGTPLASSGSGMSAATQSSPNVPMPQINYNAMFDALQQMAEIRNIDAQTNLVRSQTENTVANTELTQARKDYQNTLNKWSDLSEEQRIEQIKAAVKLALTNSDKSEAEKKKIEEEIPWIAKLSESQVKSLEENAKKAHEEAVTQAAVRYNLSAQAKAALSQASLNVMLGNKAEADIALTKALEGKTEEEKNRIVHEVNEAYYRSVQEYTKAHNLAEGIDSGSLVGSAVLWLETKVDKYTDKVVDTINEAGDMLKSASGVKSKKRNHKHDSGRVYGNDIRWNPNMQ